MKTLPIVVAQWRLFSKFLLHYPEHIKPLTREELVSLAEMCEFMSLLLDRAVGYKDFPAWTTERCMDREGLI